MDDRKAARVLAELRRRQREGSLLDEALPVQRAFIDDPAKLKAALCTRRAGKSYGCAIYLIDEALKNPGCTVLYVALTRETAKRIMVRETLAPILKARGIKARFNKVELSYTFDNGSVLYLLGLDQSEAEQEKVLGQKFRLVIVDECASWRQDLKPIVYAKLLPAVSSYEGSICLVGTPGNHFNFFHKVTTGVEKGWRVHRWTYFDNPHERDKQERTRKALLDSNPEYADTSEYKQHYLGEWAIEEDALVYRYSAERNTAKELPTGKRWLHALGVDLGFEDDTAFVVLAFCATSTELYVVEACSEKHLDFTDTAERVRRLTEVYEPYVTVIDGANKQGVEEMRQRHGIPFEAAEKSAKADHIRLMNADLQAGRVKLLPMARGLAEEWKALVWDERALSQGVRREHPKLPNHMSDACLYAWRRCYNYASRPEEERAKPGTDEWLELQLAEEEAREEKVPEYWGREGAYWTDGANYRP